MRASPWLEPNLPLTFEEASAAARKLLLSTNRLEAVVADARWLVTLFGPVLHQEQCELPEVQVVAPAVPANASEFPRWSWILTDGPPAPEYLLFYIGGVSFPEVALMLSGSVDGNGWATFHLRPFVLHRLRERFRQSVAEHEARTVSPTPRVLAAVHEEKTEFRESTLPAAAPKSAREVYLQVLAAHFADLSPRSGDDSRPLDAPGLAVHQERAYERACSILDRYGGVIIADAVGLGKTYVGLRLLEDALASANRALVVVPASLKDQWRRELLYLSRDADDDLRAHTLAPPAEVLDLWIGEQASHDVTLLSHELLGRRSFDADSYGGADLIVIDEAHNFRNPLTRRYRNLAAVSRHSRLVMLTATPINNTLFDLQHLLGLFAAPGAFRHLGIPDYRRVFRESDQNGLRILISACVLRRTRRFLREHYGEVEVRDPRSGDRIELRFPKRQPPIAVKYDLTGSYGDLFEQIEHWLSELRFPLFKPSDDHSSESVESSADLLKIILLKRLESSIEAFRSTLVHQLAWCDTALRAIDAGRVLTRPDYRASFRGPADDPGSQLALFELMLPEGSIDPVAAADYRQQLMNDRQVLAQLHSTLAVVEPRADRKLQELVRLIEQPLAGRKILIFTEFLDTARYIHRQLWNRPHVAQIDSGSARLGQERSNRREVIERFAPRSNGLPEPPERERVDILIATDVLSEGLNLQDASAVVSYDLPWNPVRLMQRSGRVDRLGALAEYIELYHFLPASDLERLLRLMDRLRRKVSVISAAVGLDHPVLAVSGRGSAYTIEQIRLLNQGTEGYEQFEEQIEGPLDPEEQAYLDFVRYLGSPSVSSTVQNAEPPAACAVRDVTCTSPRAVSYWQISSPKVRRVLWLSCDCATRRVTCDQAVAFEVFRKASSAKVIKPPADLLTLARQAFWDYARSVAAQLKASRLGGDELYPSLPQCRIAAWLGRALLSSRHRLSPGAVERIERTLALISRRFTVEEERSLARLADTLPDQFESTVLDALDAALRAIELETTEEFKFQERGTLLLLPE